MKFIIALQNKANSLQAKALDCLKRKEGQNTIEYVMMLLVVVGVAGLAGMLIKKYLPNLWDQITAKISGNLSSM